MKILTKKIVIPENPGKLENYSYTFTCPHCNNETTVVIDDFRDIDKVVYRYDHGPIDENGRIRHYTIIGELGDATKCGCCSRSISWPKNVIDDFREIAKQFDACEVYANIFYAVCYIIKHCQQSIKGFKLTEHQWIDKVNVNDDIYFTIEWKDDTPDIMMHNVSYDKLSSDEIEEVVRHIKSITFNDNVHVDMIGLKFQFLTAYSSNMIIARGWRRDSNPYFVDSIDRALLSDICNNPNVGVDNDGK